MGYIKKEYICNNSSILFKARDMGYEWNTVCRWVQDAGIHGEDGDGYTYIHHSSTGEIVSNEDLQKVIDALLDEENLTTVKVLDD